jgi:putative hemolysin
VEAGERELIERVFLFNDITAEDVMTPREDIEWLRADATLVETVPIVNKTKFSRFPVHGGDDDKVTGIVHIKDVLEAFAESAKTGSSMPLVGEIADTPMFVPETKLIDDLFRDFQRQHAHMAVVINEYGSTVGIVTVDDLLAELVGEIADESDIDEHIIKRIDKQTIVVHGDAELSDINRFFNAKIKGPSNKTVSRLILEKFGDVPQQGTQIELNEHLTATVESVANLRIQKVRLTKKVEAIPGANQAK